MICSTKLSFFPVQHVLHRPNHVLFAEAVFVQKFGGLAALAKRVVHADVFHRHGQFVDEAVGNRVAEAAVALVLFGHDDGAGLAR